MSSIVRKRRELHECRMPKPENPFSKRFPCFVFNTLLHAYSSHHLTHFMKPLYYRQCLRFTTVSVHCTVYSLDHWSPEPGAGIRNRYPYYYKILSYRPKNVYIDYYYIIFCIGIQHRHDGCIKSIYTKIQQQQQQT